MLPNTGMTFTPFDPLTAAEMNDLVENIESLSDGTGIENDVLIDRHFADSSVQPHTLLAGTGTSWVWQTWVPTYSGFTLSNGTLNAALYVQIGKTVHFYWRVTYGSSTSHTDPMIISFPVTPHSSVAIGLTGILGTGVYQDASTGTYYPLDAAYRSGSPNGFQPLLGGAAGTYITWSGVGGSAPVAAAAGDLLTIAGTYQAA